ncbi:FAD-dependent oxidoreductase [Aspergillus vadensis CBS 113365]|uniref:FAD-dependent monooxygenase n=1 Tax=Aspergillus vadensis (strain CBS 113365 / IMI 142717 / IBT 24658) TaxID=1448311 RepID=A0A319BI70_ASPVC|nr:FAD-dependent monooxygenase [Aspergillus vadensis CBS 113365]PYH71864.1 FAD-dependent monooxygenase [Aspergillus vadensis CBS 113365]
MAPKADVQVLIVGGGIAGLTLANICKKIGLSYKVFERTAEVTPVGAGISLAPNALRLLDQLGFMDIIRKEGQPLRKIQVYRNTTRWSLLDFEWLEPTYGYSMYSMPRHSMHRALYHRVDPEHVILGAEVVGIEDEPNSPTVKVRLADGREFSGEVLVGADGIRSIVRRLLADKQGLAGVNTIRFTGRTHMTGISYPLEHLGPNDLGVATWVFYDDCILTSWPCTENRQWFVGVKPSEAKTTTRSTWKGATKEMINESYGHRFHPFGKNHTGACQAIEDVGELANLLHTYFAGQSGNPQVLQDLLQEFRKSREPRARNLVYYSSIFAQVHTGRLPYGLGPLARRIAFTYAPVWCWKWACNPLYGYQPRVHALDLLSR